MTEAVPSRSTGRLRRWLFLASGAVPLLGLCGSPPDTMLLIYTTFVAGWEARRRRGLRLPGPAWVRYLVLMVLVGFLTEALAWIGNFLAREETPALLHPQLIYDLLLSPGIYGAWAVGWILATRRWRFSVAEVFIIQGIYGVFVEQQGAVFLQGWRALPLGVVLWLYVFVVYGAAAGLAYLPVEADLPAVRASGGRWKIPAALLLQFLATAIVAISWGVLLSALGVVIPDPRPIWQAPFW